MFPPNSPVFSVNKQFSSISSLCACMLNCVRLFVTPWTVACWAPLSMGFSRQEYWNGLPFPPPGDLPDSGIEPSSPALAGRFFTSEPPWKPIPFLGGYVCASSCQLLSQFPGRLGKENLLLSWPFMALDLRECRKVNSFFHSANIMESWAYESK